MGRVRETWAEAKRQEHMRTHAGRYERSWALFAQREHWRSMIPLYNTFAAAQLLRLKRDYPEAYAWLKRNA